MNKRIQSLFLFGLFALAVILRLSLALVNREANDDHMEVINLILKNNTLPTKADCWECSQPKLYHYTAALILKTLQITDADTKILVAQLINFLASVVMLWYLWLFIRSQDYSEDTYKILIFGLIAFNPSLISITAQATNDTFVITFSILALYYAQLFIHQRKYLHLLLTLLFSVLTVLSKTNGLVTAAAIGATFIFKAIGERNFSLKLRKSDLLIAGIYGMSVLALVVINPLSQYIENFQLYGSPLTLNITVPVQPFPYLFEKTDVYKPGILSIQDGFFTFKFPELLVDPQITTANKIYPPHRTSFWTILYGRANFIQYDQWPPSWKTLNTGIRRLGRVLYLLALIPSIALIIGFAIETKNFVLWILRGNESENRPTSAGLFLITGVGYLGFQIAYALRYRMFFVIKAIYIYPGILSGILFLLIGYSFGSRLLLKKKHWLNSLLITLTLLLVSLYAIDAIALFLQLRFPH